MQAERARDAIATPGSAAEACDATMRLDADAHFLLVAISNGLYSPSACTPASTMCGSGR
jgi:hypothetical protein